MFAIRTLILFSNVMFLLISENEGQYHQILKPRQSKFSFGGASRSRKETCPNVQPKPAAQCADKYNTCWSAGVRDLDCPNSGLCCYDGCANTCIETVQQPVHQPSKHVPVYQPPKQKEYPKPQPTTPNYPEYPTYPQTTPKPHTYPTTTTFAPHTYPPKRPTTTFAPHTYPTRPQTTFNPHTYPPTRKPQTYPTTTHRPHTYPTTTKAPRTYPTTTFKPKPHYPIHPVLTQTEPPYQPAVQEDTCPRIAPKPMYECGGSFSTCWSPGVADTDCPNHGLCCFDGCANTCVGQSPPPPPPPPVYTTPAPRTTPAPPVDPCNPSPCGPGTHCEANYNGNPICTCQEGLIPKPDTISGCGPECETDYECPGANICLQYKCAPKPDPCNPSPCGPGTTCTENEYGNPICLCLDGLIPKPDTITGCGPECETDYDCSSGLICKNSRCMERPDPCNPNPCGSGSICTPHGHTGFLCDCPPGFFEGDHGCIQGECEIDTDCPHDKACENHYCIDPCTSGTCDAQDICRVSNHVPICGYNYQPTPEPPRERVVIGEQYVPAPIPNVRMFQAIGGAYEGAPEPQSRTPHIIGGAFEQAQEQSSRTSPAIGGAYNKRKEQSTANSFERVIGAKYKRRKRLIKKVKKS